MVLSPMVLADAASAAIVAGLEPGTIVAAQVRSTDGKAQVTLTTDTAGSVTVAVKGAALDLLVPGATVALQVVAGADGQLALRLLSVDGQAVARPLSLTPVPSQNTPPILPDSAAAAAPSMPTAPPQPAGLLATIVRPAAATVPVETALVPSASAPAAAVSSQPQTAPPASLGQLDGKLPPDLPVGTTVAVRILDVAASPQSSAPATTVPVPPLASPVVVPPGGVPPNAVGSAVPAGPADPGQDMAPAQDGTDNPAQSLPVLEGRVMSSVPGQRAIVATPIGLLSLPAVPALAANADVKFQVIAPPVLPDDKATAPDRPANPIRALNDVATRLLDAGETQLAQRIMASIPQLDTRLAANLAIFVKAMDRQTGRLALDDDTVADLTESGHADVAEKVNGALRQLERAATDHVGQDGGWRGFSIPLHTGDAIEPVQFFIRQPPFQSGRVDPDGHQGGSGGAGKTRDQRFLVEIMLSRMGRLQMDGLVQRADKRFDLIVRTEKPLDRQMRNDITDLFITTTEAAGARGSVTFQAGGRFVAVTQAAGPTTLSV